jgi:hypothetical protein
MNYYTGGCIDYIKNDCISSYKLYDDLNELKYDLNYKICFLVNQYCNITPKNEYLYVLILDKIKKRSGKIVFKTDHNIESFESTYENVDRDILFEQELIVNDNLSILFIKNGRTIDIYSKTKVYNYGYVFYTQKLIHLYKFFIHSLYTSSNVDPFEHPDKEKSPSITDSISETSSNIFDVCDDPLSIEKKIDKEFTIKINNSTTNSTSNLFLNELKQRIKNINIQ